MNLRKFVWVGRNRKINQIMVSEPLTTEDILLGRYPSFFSATNRGEEDNCEFLMEIFEGDNLIYYSQSSMSSMTVKNVDGVFVGEGPFNTHPLEVYFNSNDFEGIEHDLSNHC